MQKKSNKRIVIFYVKRNCTDKEKKKSTFYSKGHCWVLEVFFSAKLLSDIT